MIVYCCNTNCKYNIDNKCTKSAITINLVCMDEDITGNTEVIINQNGGDNN